MLPLSCLFFGFGLMIVNPGFINSNESTKEIVFISFKQFKIVLGSSTSDALFF